MTQHEVIELLKSLQRGRRGIWVEEAHIDADKALLAFLRTIGYEDVADAYQDAKERVGFWYS